MKQKLMGWQPEQSDNKLAYAFGFIGALYQYILNIHLSTDIWSKLLEGGITAGLCGFAGMVGKWLFGVIKQYAIDPLIEYFRNRKK